LDNSVKKYSWKKKLHEIIYEADTKEGKIFDVILLIALLYLGEWVITILFSIEYILRVVCIQKPFKYIFSFYGIIDFLSTIPMYLSIIFIGSQGLIAFRALRLLRIFRILKLTRYIGASNKLMVALRASSAKIAVFLFFVVIVCIILGTVMYMVEGAENGFTNIPKSIYWAIVTLTTVGFGDIAPQTPLGQLIASAIMILGYSIIAIPTGIVSSEMTKTTVEVDTNTQSCPTCLKDKHKKKATFCYNCGNVLN
jgi:voltage-gated potassium channel